MQATKTDSAVDLLFSHQSNKSGHKKYYHNSASINNNSSSNREK
jgi:hypothetical protein